MKSRRSLVIVQVPPYPPTGGVALRNWQTINLLRQQGEVAIFSIYKGQDVSSAALQARGIEVGHFDIGQPQRPYLEKIKNRLAPLRRDGYRYTDWLYTTAAGQALDAFIKDFRPSLIVFEELWLYGYLKVVLPYAGTTGCALVLDNHNIEGSKEAYRSGSDRRRLQRIRHIEERFTRQVDQTWVCSPNDRAQLQELYPSSGRAEIVPNGLDNRFYQPARAARSHQNSDRLLFLGKFSYQPNEEAALIAMGEIMPLLKKQRPQLWLVGRDPTDAMAQAAKEVSDVHITGLVDDVRPYLSRARVMVVPLQQGGGTRLKILEAFAAGCPVVSTPKGAEGLAVQAGVHLRLGNSPAELAAHIEDLWQHSAEAQAMAERAHQLFEQTYAWTAVSQRLSQALAALG